MAYFDDKTIEEKMSSLDWCNDFYHDLIEYGEKLLSGMDKEDPKREHWEAVLNHTRHELSTVEMLINEEEELSAERPFWAL